MVRDYWHINIKKVAKQLLNIHGGNLTGAEGHPVSDFLSQRKRMLSAENNNEVLLAHRAEREIAEIKE